MNGKVISPYQDQGGNTTYLVTWQIDIDADSAEEAVAKARWYFLHTKSVFVVSSDKKETFCEA